jgi:N6-L-threonylcarbamoyladenine synthase
MRVLGIETACDDTGVGIVEDGHAVIANVVASQVSTHAQFGGVVPELAARRHVETVLGVIDMALGEASMTLADVDAVAVNCKHGLLRSVSVGVAAAKAIAYAQGVPLLGVHHVEAHLYSALIDRREVQFPMVCLAVAGGHNLLIEMSAHGTYTILGRTLDDAAGEAFDKVARLLGLPFPGGAALSTLATKGDPNSIQFPRPMIESNDLNFSFSGLKTAVAVELQHNGAMPDHQPADVAASFQEAVVEVLVSKTLRAARERDARAISVVGGVAANARLREAVDQGAAALGVECIFPRPEFCTDNGAMVAALGWYRHQAGDRAGLDLDARARTHFAPIAGER